MLAFLQSIFDGIMTLVDGIIGFFRLGYNVLRVFLDFIFELPSFLRLMVNFVADVPAYLAWLPGAVIPVCVITIIIAIIWKIFGRT